MITLDLNLRPPEQHRQSNIMLDHSTTLPPTPFVFFNEIISIARIRIADYAESTPQANDALPSERSRLDEMQIFNVVTKCEVVSCDLLLIM